MQFGARAFGLALLLIGGVLCFFGVVGLLLGAVLLVLGTMLFARSFLDR